MDHLFKTFALHCGLSQSHYWHLRLVLSVSLGPLLGVLYLVLFGRRGRQPEYTLWVSHDGRLVARPADKKRVPRGFRRLFTARAASPLPEASGTAAPGLSASAGI